MNLPRLIARWWRSRGHGVHSPFAFRFITRVLRERAPYYAYGEIDSMGGDKAWHRLLFRLVCEFEPVGIQSSHLSVDERRVIALADSRVVTGDKSPFPASFPPGVTELTTAEGNVIVLRDLSLSPGEWLRIKAVLDSGMTFTNGTVGIIVMRADLPRQDFEVDF